MWVLYGYGRLGCFPLPVPVGKVDHQCYSPYMGGRARVWQGRAVVSVQVEGTTNTPETVRANQVVATTAHTHTSTPRERERADWGTWGPWKIGPWNDGFLVRLLHSALCAPQPSPPVQGSS